MLRQTVGAPFQFKAEEFFGGTGHIKAVAFQRRPHFLRMNAGTAEDTGAVLTAVTAAGMERTGARRRFLQTEDHGIHIAAAVFGDEFRHLADGHGIGNDLPQMGIDGGAHTDDIDIAVRL